MRIISGALSSRACIASSTASRSQRLMRHGSKLVVQLSSDGNLAVIHDDLVNRTTNGWGRVGKYTLAELQALDAGAWFDKKFAGERIPTLQALLERYRGRAHLHVEIKGKTEGLSERTAGVNVRAWGVASETLMRDMVAAGVDGMTVNFPDKLMDYLRARPLETT